MLETDVPSQNDDQAYMAGRPPSAAMTSKRRVRCERWSSRVVTRCVSCVISMLPKTVQLQRNVVHVQHDVKPMQLDPRLRGSALRGSSTLVVPGEGLPGGRLPPGMREGASDVATGRGRRGHRPSSRFDRPGRLMYQLLLYVHIICAVIWVGGAFVSQILAIRITCSGHAAGL